MGANSSSDFLGLAGRVCVVTGAGSGIGRAIALAFAAEGAVVSVVDRNADACKATVSQIVEGGGKAVAIGCDVADPASVAAAGKASADALGPCDVLVNCAGVLRPGGLDELSIDEWNLVLNINLTGTFLCSQTFGRQMREKGKGALIHMASIAAANAAPSAGAYSVGKAGVAMLSRQLAIEWASHGVRSNTISPGMTLTAMTEASYTRPGHTEMRSKAIPIGRIGKPEDIANAALFLASDRSAYITGEDLVVDGGFTRNMMSLMPRTAEQ